MRNIDDLCPTRIGGAGVLSVCHSVTRNKGWVTTYILNAPVTPLDLDIQEGMTFTQTELRDGTWRVVVTADGAPE